MQIVVGLDIEQARNRSNTKLLTFCGETRPVVEWAEITGIKAATIHCRIKAGKSIEAALTAELFRCERVTNANAKVLELNGERKTVRDWAKKIGVSRVGLHKRLSVFGWDVERALTTPSQKGPYAGQL